MRKIRIVSRKYDGTLRDKNEAFLYAEDEETFVVYSPPATKSLDHRTGTWLEAPDGLLEIYFKTRWHIIWHICEQHSYRNLTYIHIAMPATLTGDTLAWVDLDLDYRIHMDGSIELLDEPEFEHHQVKMTYPRDVVDQAWGACKEVRHRYQQQDFLFNHDKQRALYQQIKKLGI